MSTTWSTGDLLSLARVFQHGGTGDRDTQWQTLPMAQIRELRALVDRDPVTHAAIEFKLRGLLSGGLFMKHGDRDIADHHYQSRAWMLWIREAVPWLYAVGFVATRFIPDPKHGYRLQVLDLATVSVQYRWTLEGRLQFRYVQFPNPFLRISGTDSTDISDVITVYMETPDSFGQIRSVGVRLLEDLQREYYLWDCTLRADRARSQPVIVTQIPEKIDSSQQKVLDTSGLGSYLGSGHAPHPRDAATSADRLPVAMKPIERPESDLAGVTRIDLPPGRVMSTQLQFEPSALSPTDFRQLRRERVFTEFGIPIAMIDGSSSSRPRSSASSGSTSSSTTRSGDSNVALMFLESQRDLQRQLCGFIEVMYQFYFFSANASTRISQQAGKKRKREAERSSPKRKARSSPAGGEAGEERSSITRQGSGEEEKERSEEEEEFDQNGVADDLGVEVTLPFLPHPSIIKDLWEGGWIRDEYFRECTSEQYQIPLRAFKPHAEPPAMAQEVEQQAAINKLPPPQKPAPA